jgi:hypothetical protein
MVGTLSELARRIEPCPKGGLDAVPARLPGQLGPTEFDSLVVREECR